MNTQIEGVYSTLVQKSYKKENKEMAITFSEFLDRYRDMSMEEIELSNLQEAGNISSGLILKKHNDALKHGRNVIRNRIRDRDLNDKLDSLARQLDAVSAITVIAAALSGKEESSLSTIAQGSSLRSI